MTRNARETRHRWALVVLALVGLACQEPRAQQPAARTASPLPSAAPDATTAPAASPASPAPSSAPPPPAVAPPTPSAAPPASAASAPPPAKQGPPPIARCEGSDRRIYGTACCTLFGTHEDRFPGQTILSCEGPRIGKPCRRKQDCDIACSCGKTNGPRRPGDPMPGPPSGTRGQTGVCGGDLQVGVWMCEINEKGEVSHKIID